MLSHLPLHIAALKKTLWAVFMVFMLTVPLQKSMAMGLKENVVVTANTIKLGDIFYGLPKDKDRVLGISPRPGEKMVLNARTLLRIALALDLPWRPASSGDQVSIQRDATIIKRGMIEENIKQALVKQEGLHGSFALTIPADYSQIVLPNDQPASLDVTDISLDRYRNTLEVTIAAPSRENPIQKIHVKGSVFPLILVPVLKTNIKNGHIISADDIDFIEIREKDFVQGTIVDEQSLIGMTPRRLAVAGRPLRGNDIIAPRIISRGEYVTMVLNSGALSLTAMGKALENGSKGEIIRVVNVSSNITVQAVVTGQKQVRIITE